MRSLHEQAGPVAVTVGLLGELGYVGIEAVRRAPAPPQAFRRRRTRVGRDTAQACGGRQRVDMQLQKLAFNTMRSCPCSLRLRASLTMPLMTGKTNVRPVDGPAVTDRDKH